jgi:probable phosphoglycerate mutase
MQQQLTRVILVRHGESTYNAQKRFQGCCDDSILNEKGRLQAYGTGIALSKLDIDTVYCSPLRRTQETAKEIIAALATVGERNLTINLHNCLKEIDLPDWEGLSFQYVRKNLSQKYRIWEENPAEFTTIFRKKIRVVEGIAKDESWLEFTTKEIESIDRIEYPVVNLHQQAEQFWQQELPAQVGKTILVVSHGGTIRALINTALGIECDRYHYLQQSNCGISILEFDNLHPVRSAQLRQMNSTVHLGEILPKLKSGKLGMRLLLVSSDNIEYPTRKKIKKSLEKIKIDLCLNNDYPQAQKMAEFLIKDCDNSPIHLQTSENNVIQTWHRSWQSQSRNFEFLITALAICDRHTIQNFLGEVFGIKDRAFSWYLESGKIAILHYPLERESPVLQAFNWD